MVYVSNRVAIRYLFLIVFCSLLISSQSLIFAQEKILAQGPNNTLVNKIPDDLPLRVKIRNADSRNWIDDLEIEITNLEKKTIYFFQFILYLDGIKSAEGYNTGFPLTYNPGNFTNFFQDAEKILGNSFASGDKSLDRNETIILKVNPDNARAWKLAKEQQDAQEPEKMILKFHFLMFGDESGILAKDDANGNRISTPHKKKNEK